MAEPDARTVPAFPEPLAERLLAELRVEIARADSKAAVLVAALGLASGLFGGAVAESGWSPGALSAAGQVLWWGGALALALALGAFLLAVAPRCGPAWAPGAPLTFFGDIHQASEHGALEEALAATEKDPQLRLLRALESNSRIAAVKLRWVRVGLVAFATGALSLPVALLTR